MAKIDTERKRRFIINTAYFAIIIVLAYIILKYALPYLGPFVVAFLFAWALQRPIRYLHKTYFLNKRLCGAIIVAAFFVIIGGLISLVGTEVVTWVQRNIQLLPSFYSYTLVPHIEVLFDKIERSVIFENAQLYMILEDIEAEFFKSATQKVSELSMAAVGAISSFAASIPALFIKLVLLVISTFFISMDYDKLVGFCLNQVSDQNRNLIMQIKNYVVGTLFVCIRSYALIMSITFVELSIGLTLVGIKHGVLIAACISVFDILPVLGTGGIMIPWAVTNFVLGNIGLGIKLLLVYVVFTVIRNILEPKIVGGQLGLHPVVTLASMFAGVQLLGVVGLFGFPIFLSLLCHLNDTGAIKIFK